MQRAGLRSEKALGARLQRGHSFSNLQRRGFQASRPRYSRITAMMGLPPDDAVWRSWPEASCVSTTPQTVSSDECYSTMMRSTSAIVRRREGPDEVANAM